MAYFILYIYHLIILLHFIFIYSINVDYLLIDLFVYLFIYLFIHLFIYLFIYLFI